MPYFPPSYVVHMIALLSCRKRCNVLRERNDDRSRKAGPRRVSVARYSPCGTGRILTMWPASRIYPRLVHTISWALEAHFLRLCELVRRGTEVNRVESFDDSDKGERGYAEASGVIIRLWRRRIVKPWSLLNELCIVDWWLKNSTLDNYLW
ncbi:hypothetical protein BO443_30048 [Burkholderia orbicola]